VESQEEMHIILEKSFGNLDTMDYKRFLYVIENISSEIYIYVLVFLLQNKPFTNTALGEYEKQKTNFLKVTTPTSNLSSSPTKLLASPNINSKFSPSVAISRSPLLNTSPGFRLDDKEESKNYLLKVAGMGMGNNPPVEFKRTETKSKTVQMNQPLKINIVEPTVPVNRKIRHNLKNIDEVKPQLKDSKNEYENLPITPAAKVSNNSVEKPDDLEEDSDSDEGIDMVFEGHLYKITEDKQIKRLWFKLINRDLYCKYFLTFSL
jgi:hypothetical protein